MARQAKVGNSAAAADSWLTFGRHQIGAFVATVVDFCAMVLLVERAGVSASLGAAIGASVGAVTNFTLARAWIFRRQSGGAPSQAARYAAVAAASALWNALGEHLLHDGLHMQYVLARFVVSAVVGFAWNFPMHRRFVFREKPL